ncbi:MAG: polyhydroxyalkanoate depolymerase [Cellvibrionaceae bacterium]|nr:polyhydroxyalkanoate depolymerase [Cellvibrionaceae bacterium]
MLYQTYDLYQRNANIANSFFSLAHHISSHPNNPWSNTLIGKTWSAGFESAARSTKQYHKLDFDYGSCEIDGKTFAIEEEVSLELPFCNLLHFKKPKAKAQNKVLVVAAMSGHHATLLKDTVKALLPDHDVYLTDWNDAKNVPLSEGKFGFDDYVDYLIKFMEQLGPESHMLAVCQPTVQALIATAIMAEAESNCTPKSLTLMAGPIDTRIRPNQVNNYATENDIDFFKKNVIKTVPKGFKGAGRKVYPGFLQLTAFISMNLSTHIKKHTDFFSNIVLGKTEDAQAHREFYDEYMAVLDMTEEFYLETLEKVFMDHQVAKGTITHKGKKVNFDAIQQTALFTVEGEVDDICSLGQTEAAQTVCKKLKKSQRQHQVFSGVGHYGVFSGSKYRDEIAPAITEFIHKNA